MDCGTLKQGKYVKMNVNVTIILQKKQKSESL